jgi:hypothetical protein
MMKFVVVDANYVLLGTYNTREEAAAFVKAYEEDWGEKLTIYVLDGSL